MASPENMQDPNQTSQHQFHIADYIVFGSTIVISIGIGIFYAVMGRRKSNTSEYLVGGRSMHVIPTAISLLVSFESSIMMLGTPAENYVFGMQYIWYMVGICVSQLLSVMVIVPMFHPLKITSAYEYLEMRFQSKTVRLMGTTLGIITYTWYMGIVLFGPAVALEAVTGYPLWNSIVVIAGVSVIYTAIGGLKAVIWTDVFQALVMFSGIFSILIKGTIDVGGPKKVWDIASAGGRMNFFNFDPDPSVRHTFWNLFLGSVIRGFGLGFNQSTVQRISSTKTVGQAKRMLLIVAPTFLITLVLASYEGIVAYSYFQVKGCDPLASKQIANPNQLVPFIVMEIFGKLPGMPGLFLASLFSASLSTLSSGLSSVAALTWSDILHPRLGDISEVKATIIIKVTVVLYGCVACGISFLVAQIGGTLTQIAGTLLSTFAGPLTGVFFLGCFFPRANAKGSLIGGFISLVMCVWISMGMNFSPAVKKTPGLPPASTENCFSPIYNVTGNYSTMETWYETSTHSYLMTTASSIEAIAPEPKGIEVIYTLSYQWLSAVGIIGTIIVGLIASVFTGMNRPGDVDPRYLISMSETLLIFLPGPMKRWLSSIGPQYMDEKYKSKFTDPSKLRLDPMNMEVQVVPVTDKVGNANGERHGNNGTTVTLTHITNEEDDLDDQVTDNSRLMATNK
ncbi:hypothetical protein EGW08_001210 [Elysia chlorotica]|uniref:Sodium-coupled monocarboxylate transporter 1 n=1 Tax=Elysia chlorotica TaxID=188477 RepID=A0A433UB82_ELYCH|nr:hypothetical protein EGW08_001210 [Elysia chlorotica]